MAIFSKNKQQTAEAIEQASRTAYVEYDDTALAALRAETIRAKSEFRQEHLHIRERARLRIADLKVQSREELSRFLRRRLPDLGAPGDVAWTFTAVEASQMVMAFTDLAEYWTELLDGWTDPINEDLHYAWSDISLDEFRARLDEFDATVASIDKEIALRAAKVARLEAEERERAVAGT